MPRTLLRTRHSLNSLSKGPPEAPSGPAPVPESCSAHASHQVNNHQQFFVFRGKGAGALRVVVPYKRLAVALPRLASGAHFPTFSHAYLPLGIDPRGMDVPGPRGPIRASPYNVHNCTGPARPSWRAPRGPARAGRGQVAGSDVLHLEESAVDAVNQEGRLPSVIRGTTGARRDPSSAERTPAGRLDECRPTAPS